MIGEDVVGERDALTAVAISGGLSVRIRSSRKYRIGRDYTPATTCNAAH